MCYSFPLCSYVYELSRNIFHSPERGWPENLTQICRNEYLPGYKTTPNLIPGLPWALKVDPSGQSMSHLAPADVNIGPWGKRVAIIVPYAIKKGIQNDHLTIHRARQIMWVFNMWV